MTHNEIRIGPPKWSIGFWCLYIIAAVFPTSACLLGILVFLYSFGLGIYRIIIGLTLDGIVLLISSLLSEVLFCWVFAVIYMALVRARTRCVISKDGIKGIPPILAIPNRPFTVPWDEIEEAILVYSTDKNHKPETVSFIRKGTKKNWFGKWPLYNQLYYRRIFTLAYSKELSEIMELYYKQTISVHFGKCDNTYL